MQPAPPESQANNVTRYILIAVALLALGIIAWRVADVLVIGFGGIVLAAVLRALAKPLARWTGWRDRWCVLTAVAVIALVLVGLGWMFGQQAASQATQLQQQLPAAFNKVLSSLQKTETGKNIISGFQDGMDQSKALSKVGIAATALLGGLADLLLVMFLGIYFALDPRMYRNGVLRLLAPRLRPTVGDALDDAGEALQKWLVAQAIAMITVGVMVGAGLALVGVPLSFALGVLASLFEFVPVLGPILFSLPGLLLAFAKGPETALYALIVYLVVQQFEGNVLIPLLQRWAVELPPVVGLMSIVAGGLLLGVPGIVFATPMAVVIMRLVKHLYVEETLENQTPSAPVVRSTA